jgi:hypothetical protein
MNKVSQLKVFLSYSSDDKALAGSYKNHLEKYYGFGVFVAHDDNVPSCDWGPEIKDSISKTDIFIVLISEASKKSEFVNQEIGIAIAFNIRIFPIKIDGSNPFGFIYKIHGFPYIKDQDKAILENGSKLFSILTSSRDEFKAFGDLAIESAIYSLSKTSHFKETNIIIKTLMETEAQRGFNPNHLSLLKAVCHNNYEVYGGAFEYYPLKKLLENKYDIEDLP